MEGTNLMSHYDPGCGLSASYAISILRDNDGVVWFGHRREISLFDGTGWSALPLQPDAKPLDDVTANALHQSADGAVWIATEEGVLRCQKSAPPARRPVLQLKADQEFADPKSIPSLATGSRLTFNFAQADRSTPPEKQQFRWQFVHGTPTPAQLEKSGP